MLPVGLVMIAPAIASGGAALDGVVVGADRPQLRQMVYQRAEAGPVVGFSLLVGFDPLIYAALCHGAAGAITATAYVALATFFNLTSSGIRPRKVSAPSQARALT